MKRSDTFRGLCRGPQGPTLSGRSNCTSPLIYLAFFIYTPDPSKAGRL